MDFSGWVFCFNISLFSLHCARLRESSYNFFGARLCRVFNYYVNIWCVNKIVSCLWLLTKPFLTHFFFSLTTSVVDGSREWFNGERRMSEEGGGADSPLRMCNECIWVVHKTVLEMRDSFWFFFSAVYFFWFNWERETTRQKRGRFWHEKLSFTPKKANSIWLSHTVSSLVCSGWNFR